MSVNLQKGQKIDLTKGNASLDKIVVGLGWDAAVQKKGIFGSNTSNIDCDASAILLNEAGKLTDKNDIIYFGNLNHRSMSVNHMGDNLTGDGDGDDEQIMVMLSRVPQEIHRIVFIVNIFDCLRRKQDFGMIRNAFIRIFNSADNKELLKYNLTDDYAGKTALIVGEVYRYNGEWKFSAVGEGLNLPSISEVSKRYM